MKNRNIPYGYCYQDGVITVHPAETSILSRIVKLYLDGLSLLKIAEQLNEDKIQFMPGVVGWNKARLARIVEDTRYTGDGGYPVIIDHATLEAMKGLKASKNTKKNIDRTAEILNLGVPVFCESCGGEMRRFHDKRCKCHERWMCQNPNCKSSIRITDHDILERITECMNLTVTAPDLIKSEPPKNTEPNMEVCRLENEIGRMLDSVNFDKEVLRRKMLECVSLKYSDIPSTTYITRRIKADIENAAPLTHYSADLFRRIAQSVTINQNGTVSVTLINGQQIQKEQHNDTNDTHAN